jgi:hypothetical protein
MDRARPSRVKKRKAENQDNERLSKRLSLLNLGPYSLTHLITIWLLLANYLQNAMAKSSMYRWKHQQLTLPQNLQSRIRISHKKTI